jgi:eukaryotic-like serine/threonine-protein kinase
MVTFAPAHRVYAPPPMSLGGSPDEALAAAEGTFAGRYVVAGLLAWNGLAFVFRAVEPGRSVAVAAFGDADGRDADRSAKFLRRAQAVAELQHPALVPVTERGVEQGVPYLEMELVPGPTLAEARAQDGPFSRERAFHVADAVLDALEVAHDRRAMHWDLTPANVILSPGEGGPERVRLVGLGFRALLGSAGHGRASGPGATRFIAPEVWGASPDGRADLYSVGALLQWMLTGRVPAPGGRGRGTGWARPIVARALAKVPVDRFADARSMRIALRKAFEGQVVPMPPRPRLRRAVMWSTASAACLAVGIFGGLQLRSLRSATGVEQGVAMAEVSAPSPSRDASPEAGKAPTGPLDEVPEALSEVYERVRAGARLSRDELAPLRAHTRDHPNDVRGHLILAHAYANLGWQSAAVDRYLVAHGVDASIRSDERVLQELLGALPHPDLHDKAARALSRIYGFDAIGPVEALISSGDLSWAEHQRLRRYVERLKGRQKRAAGESAGVDP